MHFAKILTEVIARARVVVAFVRGEEARIDADLKNKIFNDKIQIWKFHFESWWK